MNRDRMLDRWDEVDALITRALDLPVQERQRWLEAECGDDAELLELVRSVLTREAGAGNFLSGDHRQALVEAAGLSEPGDADGGRTGYAPGDRIGSWTLIEEIGRGGSGTVYLADRADGSYSQHVALKLLRRGLDTDDVLARFRAERQILASLNHPSIARLLGGGATDDGRPYLVMELVDGEPITLYADRRRLTVDQRLRLFVTVARAVQYAHRNLIVHRDIKPGNILVAADGEVKLLDFGIAKLLDDSPASGTAPHTRTGYRLFTPEYASPEQLRGEPVTTASDVYQLGILLYRLLSGRLPAPASSARGTLGGDDMVPPSAALGIRPGDGEHLPPAEIAAHRDTDVRRLRSRLRGDLDLIALAALRAEPERRYATAAEMADDVERHLEGRPITARPDAWRYRTAKLIHRHPAAAAAVAAGMIALTGYVATLQSYTQRLESERTIAQVERERAESALAVAEEERTRAEEARDRAEAERVRAERAQRIAEEERGRAQMEWARAEGALVGERKQTERAERVSALLVSIFETFDPAESGGAELPVRTVLQQGVSQTEYLAEDVETQGDLLEVLSRVHKSLGMYPEAHELAERSLAIRRETHGSEHALTAVSLNQLGDVLMLKGRFAEAEASHRQALAIQRRLFGNDHPSVAASLNYLGEVLRHRGSYAEAETFHRQALAMRRALLGDDHPDVATTLNDLAEVLRRQDRFYDAVQHHRQALAMRRAVYGDIHPAVAASLTNLGVALDQSGDSEAAEQSQRQALELSRALLGDEHPRIFVALNALGITMSRRGNLAAAEEYHRQALDLGLRLDPDHPRVGQSLYNLGFLYRDQDHAAAERYFREAHAVWVRVHGTGPHPDVAAAQYNLGLVLRDQGDLDTAERYLRESLAMVRRVSDSDHHHLHRGLSSLADVLRIRGRWDESEALYREVLELRLRAYGREDHPNVIRTRNDLRQLLAERGAPIVPGPPG
jgi:eukaryotic-like serine/threonine-protein kinase